MYSDVQVNMLFRDIWGVLTEPTETWARVREESVSLPVLYLRIILPLAIIPPVSAWIGAAVFGWRVAGPNTVRLTTASATGISIVYFLAILVAIFALGYMVAWMSETYGNKQPLSRCVALIAYSAMPLFLISFFQLYPVLWINFIAGLPALAYSVFLLYCGVPIVMDVSPERGFLFASAVLAVSLVALVGLLVTSVMLWSFGLGPAFTI